MARLTLLIDGDEFLFKATSSVEREIQWDDVNHVLYCNRNEAWDNFQRLVDRLRDELGGGTDTDAVLCFSGKRPYFREHLSSTYKGGRPTRKPLCYSALRDLCAEHYTVRSTDGLEADDVMGILATKPNRKTTYIICSQDKDMQTIPCSLFRGFGQEVKLIDETEADRFWLLQTLMGDATDNYKGCPGMGEKTGVKWLEEHGWDWSAVVAAYEKADQTEADALVQARLARILRWSDWDSKTKQPKLWSP